MPERDVPLEVGTGIIDFFRAMPGLTWKKMLAEWIDNAFGAGATKVWIRKEGKVLTVGDNGQGCDNLIMMESLARSVKRKGNKAGMYGIGGVMSQIYATNAGLVAVDSTTKEKRSQIEIDWGRCLREDRLVAALEESPVLKGKKTGTTITMQPCERIYDLPKIVRELGYYYAGMFRSGYSITMEIDGEVTRVKAYRPPPFSRMVEFEFVYDGHRITGSCRLVKPGERNPFHGWSVHWGYRILGKFVQPAGDKAAHRIYGEVYLPEGWTNINVTKDDFNQDVDDLWEAIGEQCREVIDAADAESQEIELTSASKAAEDIIGQALKDKGYVKGARPGDAGEKGTVTPNGRGGAHGQFSKTQPGDKAEVDDASALPNRTPDKVKINWDDTIEEPYLSEFTGTRRSGRIMTLTLNSAIPQIVEFRDDPSKLATYCLAFVAREIAEGVDNNRLQKAFPSFATAEFKEVYTGLLDRIATAISTRV